MSIPSPFWAPHRHADRRPRLLARARLASALRTWFAGEGFVEVEPAALQLSPGNETHLHGFSTELIAGDGARTPAYLHTSPEFAMKKLLAAGETRIFALARVFRNRERTALHAPEFTMLEWYRVGEGPEALMRDAAAVLRLAAEAAGTTRLKFRGREADAFAEPERLTVREAFWRHAGVDLFEAQAERDALAAAVAGLGLRVAADDFWSDLFSRLLSEKVEPNLGLGRPTFLTDYPAREAALARLSRDDPRIAERFELYACGVELANAFGELTDPAEQRRRFEDDMALKRRIYGESYPIDEDFLACLPYIAESAGAALGFDRVAMLACGADQIEDVQWTPVFPAVTADIARAREALHRVFGFADFRAGQEDVLRAVLDGENVMAIMPTGSGKSLLFQLPALLGDGLTIVVSPLIALMRDQVAQMRAYGVAAAALNSAADGEERRAIYEGLENGRLKLLYVAPERLMRDDTLELLHRQRIDLLAIDEAHCVSQWGHDFRPEYIRLKEAAQALGRPRTLAVTATADAPTRRDIAQRLFFSEPREFVRSFDRPNLFLSLRPKTDATRQLWETLQRHPGESGIVYCASRKRTEELAREFSQRGRRALPYHAGLDPADRSANQDAFLQEDGVVICATIAFGMGVDKPDVRFVCHADMPSSIESYYQEIGRAGRDGLPADTMTLYSLGDIELRRRQIEEGAAPPERKRIEQDKLEELVALCESARCRRQVLLGFFGEDSAPCGHCDVCKGAVRLIDGRLDAQKALSAVLRTEGRFFFGHLANILSGKRTEAVERHGHDGLKTFGVGADRSPDGWRAVFRQLISARMLTRDREDRDRLVLTEAGRRALKGEAAFQLREDVVAPKAKGARKTPPTPRDADADLIGALKALRAAMAKAQKIPAYVIFPDRTLIEMASTKPASLAQLAEIHGVGEQKLTKYGSAFLAVLKDHA